MMVLRSTTNRFRMLALLMLAGATLSACTPAPEPTPTPTAAFASEEEAFAAAEEVYRAYNDAFNAVDYSDPSTFDQLDEFTSGTYRSEEREGLSQLHAEGVTRTGAAAIEWFRGATVTSDGTVSARVCKDLSDVDVVDADGTSLVSPTRPDHSAVDVTFTMSGSRLSLSESQAVEDETCAGS
ncbi:hypothetical protein [Microbacterium tenebrionis]|uniref:hypothetical protein n=1 Tax=Microbacterium tenebrionis TaxID=2830665 RepID=UPI00158D114D|nr:hypothetical protein [Microbacterium ihumii]